MSNGPARTAFSKFPVLLLSRTNARKFDSEQAGVSQTGHGTGHEKLDGLLILGFVIPRPSIAEGGGICSRCDHEPRVPTLSFFEGVGFDEGHPPLAPFAGFLQTSVIQAITRAFSVPQCLRG